MAADAGVEFWKYPIGTKAVVWYSDDVVWHERYILLPGGNPEDYWIITPDGDIYEECLKGKAADGPQRVRIVPREVRTLANLRTSVYRFAEDFDDAVFREHIATAIQEHKKAYGLSRLPREHPVTLPSGSEDRLDSFLPGRQHRITGKGGNGFVTRPGSSWVVADPRGDLHVGDVLHPDSSVDKPLGGKDAVFLRDGLWVRGELVLDSIREHWIVERIKHLTGSFPPTKSPDPAELLGIPAASAGIDVSKAAKEAAPEIGILADKDEGESDARTLWAEFDEQGERYREWRRVVADSTPHAWKDWPHQGPSSLMHMLKHFMKHGGEPKSWFQIWLRKHHLQETDRTAHEVRCLVEALWLGGTYDQVNMPALASFEILGRRLQTIVEAYSSSAGGVPDWQHAKLFTGAASADDLVSPELRSWAAKKGKEEVELAQARAKIREAKKLLASTETTTSALDEALPKAKGNQKGRPRKTLEAPPAT